MDQGILNMVEMAFRAYDPCFGCATHYAVGQMPLTVEVYDSKRKLIKTVNDKPFPFSFYFLFLIISGGFEWLTQSTDFKKELKKWLSRRRKELS